MHGPSSVHVAVPAAFAEGGLEGRMLALLVENGSAARENGLAQVDSSFQRLEELRAEIQRALESAHEAREDSSFWGSIAGLFGGDISGVAQAVAAAALVVGSGGAAAPLLLATASIALAASAKLAAEHGADPKLCAALGLASAALGVCSGNGAAVSGTARDVATAASATAGAASAAGGAAGIKSAYEARLAAAAEARATRAEQQRSYTLFALDQLYADLRRLIARDADNVAIVADTRQADFRTNAALIANLGAYR